MAKLKSGLMLCGGQTAPEASHAAALWRPTAQDLEYWWLHMEACGCALKTLLPARSAPIDVKVGILGHQGAMHSDADAVTAQAQSSDARPLQR